MTKRIVAVIFVLVLAAAAVVVSGCGGNSVSGSTMAKVGKVSISQKDFNAHLDIYLKLYEQTSLDKKSSEYRDFEKSVLEDMVVYEVVKQKSASLSISISDAEVQTQIDSDVTNSFNGDESALETELKGRGLTLDQLKEYYKERMLVEKAYNQVNISTKVTDSEISDYYNKHKSEYVTAETRKARHILISPTADRPTTTTTAASSSSSGSTTTAASTTTTTEAPATDAEWAAALAKAQKVRADLIAGADWKTEAAKYSNDTGSKDSGGDLGTVSKGDMVASVDAAIFGQKLNEISQPVKSTYGYHIIQVTGITAAKQQTLSEVKSTISDTLLSDKKTQVWNKWLDSQKDELSVVYKEGYKYTTTTTSATTTTKADTGTTAGASTTTAASATTTTAKN